MAHMKALRPHISADGVFRAVGEVYEDDNAVNLKIRVDGGIVEQVDDPKPKLKKNGKPEEPVTTGQDAGLIED